MENYIIFVFLAIFGVICSSPIDNTAVNTTNYDFQIFQGDMLFKKGINPGSFLRNANIQTRKWPNGLVPYRIDPASGYSQSELQEITKSMRTIERQTNNCIRFVERSYEREYLIIRHTQTGCNSYVGQIDWQQPQQVSLERPYCMAASVIVHELLHAIGFEHEHCRPDRDYYIKIHKENMLQGWDFAFDLQPSTMVSTLNQEYDFWSIMHYQQDAFSKNRLPTITSRISGIDMNKVGTRDDLSPTDIEKIKIFYNC